MLATLLIGEAVSTTNAQGEKRYWRASPPKSKRNTKSGTPDKPKTTTSVTARPTSLFSNPNAPTLNITSPRAGDTWQGQQTIAWTGADADGGALTYTVLYTPNGGKSWYPIELDTTNPQLVLSAAEIASGDQVYFRVLASDGLNTTKAEVGPIRVVGGMPPATSVAQPPPSIPTGDTTSGALALMLCGGVPCLGAFALLGGIVLFTRSRTRARPAEPRPSGLPEQSAPRKPTALPEQGALHKPTNLPR